RLTTRAPVRILSLCINTVFHLSASSSFVRFPALFILFFFFHDTATPAIYTLSLHDALPICHHSLDRRARRARGPHHSRGAGGVRDRKEHTSELQSRFDLVCRLLLEKKKKTQRWLSSSSSCTAGGLGGRARVLSAPSCPLSSC